MFLDFSKAYDSVDHEFIYMIMEALDIGENFINWTKLGLTETVARLIINGGLSGKFELGCGGRQGGVLFPSIFCIVVMCITIMIEEDENIKGISLSGSNFKVMQYADGNVEGFTSYEEFVAITDIINFFCNASGMEINWKKKIGMVFGEMDT